MFFYGPDRRLLEQLSNYVADGQSGSESTVYVFGLYEYETTPAQNHNKYFIQVPGGTQIVYDIQSISGAQTTYITADHLGSGNIFLNSAGRKLLNESFSAYGYRRSSNWSRPLSSTSSDYTTIASTTRRGYTDAFHEVFDNLDLIQMRGRVYDPVIGRFMSPDPIVTQVGNSQSINPYSYVQNRPLTLTDPTGMAVSRNQPIDPLRNLGRLSWQQARRLGLTGEISGVAPTGTANQGDSWQALQGYSTAVGNGSSSGGSVGFTQDPSLAQLNQPPPNPQGTADPTLNAASAQGAAAAAPPSDQTSTTTEGGSPDDLQPVNVTAQYKDPETGKLLPPNVSVTPDGQYMIRGTTIPLAPMPGCTGLCAAMTNSTVYGGNSYVRETPGSNGTKVDVVTTDQNGDVFDVTTFSLIDPNQGSGYNTWRSFGDWWAENGDGKQQGTQQQGTQQQN
jgi:RHS repeat-associated protein